MSNATVIWGEVVGVHLEVCTLASETGTLLPSSLCSLHLSSGTNGSWQVRFTLEGSGDLEGRAGNGGCSRYTRTVLNLIAAIPDRAGGHSIRGVTE